MSSQGDQLPSLIFEQTLLSYIPLLVHSTSTESVAHITNFARHPLCCLLSEEPTEQRESPLRPALRLSRRPTLSRLGVVFSSQVFPAGLSFENIPIPIPKPTTMDSNTTTFTSVLANANAKLGNVNIPPQVDYVIERVTNASAWTILFTLLAIAVAYDQSKLCAHGHTQ